MKKCITAMIALALAIALLAGCDSGGYRYVQESDGGYIILKDPGYSPEGFEFAPKIYFESFEEMRSDISEGNFTEEELAELARFEKDDEGKILVCSLSGLHEPMFLDAFSYKISWSGRTYCFYLTEAETGVKVRIHQDVQATYDLYNGRRTSGTWTPGAFDESETQFTTISDRNASVYYCERTRYTGTIDTEKYIFYAIDVNGTAYIVQEHYEEATDDLASRIYVYGYSNGFYFTATITGISERPSVEWLSQFGLREHVDTEVS